MTSRWHAPAAALLLLSATRPLQASEPSSSAAGKSVDAANDSRTPSPTRRAELAREQGHLGLAAYAEQRWRDALKHFGAAEDFMHSPVFTLYVARSHEKLGELELAREHFEELAAEDLPPEAPSAWHEARASAIAALRDLPSDASRTEEPAESNGPEPGPTPRGPAHPGTASTGLQTSPPGDVHPYRYGAYAAFGVGLAGLVVGGVAGTMAYVQAADIRSRCDGDRCLPSDAPNAQEARRLAHVATAGFIVAATGAAAGLTLWLLPTASPQNGVALVLSPAAASVRGSF